MDKVLDHEDEYIDEDRFTTVTVESVTVSKDGLNKPAAEDDPEVEADKTIKETAAAGDKKDKAWPPKKKKPKFRYETKIERQMSRRKQGAKKKGNADKKKAERA